MSRNSFACRRSDLVAKTAKDAKDAKRRITGELTGENGWRDSGFLPPDSGGLKPAPENMEAG